MKYYVNEILAIERTNSKYLIDGEYNNMFEAKEYVLRKKLETEVSQKRIKKYKKRLEAIYNKHSEYFV